MTKSTIHGLNRAQLEALQTIAKRLGYTTDRGPTPGQGSASALIRAIADGELMAIRRSDFDELKSQLEGMWERRKGDDL